MIVHSLSSVDNAFVLTTSQVKSEFLYHHLNVYPFLVPLRSSVQSSHRLTVKSGLLGLLFHQLSSYAKVFHTVFLKQRTALPSERLSNPW